jgi:hypothetical protein
MFLVSVVQTGGGTQHRYFFMVMSDDSTGALQRQIRYERLRRGWKANCTVKVLLVMSSCFVLTSLFSSYGCYTIKMYSLTPSLDINPPRSSCMYIHIKTRASRLPQNNQVELVSGKEVASDVLVLH